MAERCITVDGRKLPLSIMQLTAGTMQAHQSPEASRSACVDHLKTLKCQHGEGCPNIHFKQVNIKDHGIMSAGRFEPSNGLLHFANNFNKFQQAWICRDWKQNGGNCYKGLDCQFMHDLRLEEILPQVVLKRPVGPATAVAKRPSPLTASGLGSRENSEDPDKFPTLPGSKTASPLTASGNASITSAPAAKKASTPVSANATAPKRQTASESNTSSPAAPVMKLQMQQPKSAGTSPKVLQTSPKQQEQPPNSSANHNYPASTTSTTTTPVASLASPGAASFPGYRPPETLPTPATEVTLAPSLDASSLPCCTNADDAHHAAQLLHALRQHPLAKVDDTARQAILSLIGFFDGQLKHIDAGLTIMEQPVPPDLFLMFLPQAVDACARGAPLTLHTSHAALLWQFLIQYGILRDTFATHLVARCWKLEDVRPVVQLLYLTSLHILKGTDHMRQQLCACLHVWGLGSIVRGAKKMIERWPEDWSRETSRFVREPELASRGPLVQLQIVQKYMNAALQPDVTSILNEYEPSLCSSNDGKAQMLYRSVVQHRPTLQDQTIFSDGCVWDSFLFAIEQRTSRQLMRETAIQNCYIVGSRTVDVLPHVVQVASPGTGSGHSSSSNDMWLEVRIDPSRTLCFPQWQPQLFIGQFASLACPEAEEKTYRFKIASIDPFSLTISKDPSEDLPPLSEWFQNNFFVTVQIEHNSWHLTSLLEARRKPASTAFLTQLREGTLRPGDPARISPAARADVTQRMRLDKQQMDAVLNVLARPRLSVLWGPPGTGKTHTITSAIAAIVKHGCGRVLACATSNYAVNVLSQRLIAANIPVLRAFTRSTSPRDVQNSVFADLLNHSNAVICPRTRRALAPDEIELDSTFSPVTADDIQAYPVICITTAHTQWMQSVSTDFSFVFIDECSQATEAESLMPLTFVDDDCSLVLSGDPHQLGPSVVSIIADNLGLGASLLHRHFDVCGRPPVSASLLVNCYRCNPGILNIFNRLFYNNALATMATDLAKRVPNCSLLKNPRYPIACINVPQPQQDEASLGFSSLDFYLGNAPSSSSTACLYENDMEAMAVLHVLRTVIEENHFSSQNVGQMIGIIAPYRQQVLKLQGLLRENPLTAQVLVGTVDQYQGQERPIIIISTVRATKDTFPGSDFTLSFIGDRKKTNVAISRAERLLVVVGDVGEMSKNDPAVWGVIVQTALANKALLDLPAEVYLRNKSSSSSVRAGAGTKKLVPAPAVVPQQKRPAEPSLQFKVEAEALTNSGGGGGASSSKPWNSHATAASAKQPKAHVDPAEDEDADPMKDLLANLRLLSQDN